jgi:DNA-directed RNA polymerase specialized sigma24 family protein
MLQKTFTHIAGETISDSLKLSKTEISVIYPQANETILQRIAQSDKNAVGECLDKYGNYVWTIAKKMTRTQAETEKAVQEIFLDIWKNARFFDAEKLEEQSFIAHITLKRLLKNHTQRRTI